MGRCDQHKDTGHLSVVAEVLATGEPTLLLTCSIPQAVNEMKSPAARRIDGGRLGLHKPGLSFGRRRRASMATGSCLSSGMRPSLSVRQF